MVCSSWHISRLDLGLEGDVERVIDGILDYVKYNACGDDAVIYFRSSVKVRDILLDIIRFIGRALRLYNLLRLKLKMLILSELINSLTNLNGCKPSLEVVVTTTTLSRLENICLGDFYLSEMITPISYALTSLEIKGATEYVVFDEVRFNICSISKDFRIVGCLFPLISGSVDLSYLELVVNNLRDVVSRLNFKHRYITWLLSQGDLHILDY